jgi:excisionase family DNA binding protein
MEETMLVQLNVRQLQGIIQESVAYALKQMQSANHNKNEDEQIEEDILYVNDVCRLLNIKPVTLYAKTSKEEIPHFKKGRKLYFSRKELQKWILSGQKLTIAEREELSQQNLLACNKRRLNKL